MWAIIYTVCALPLILSLWWVGHKAKRAGALVSYKTPYQIYGGKRLVVALFWQLDVIGIILLILVFGLILVPFTVAKGSAEIWATAKIIVPLVLGVLLVPVWIYWEKRAPHPLLPFHVSFPRAVWVAKLLTAIAHEGPLGLGRARYRHILQLCMGGPERLSVYLVARQL
jgi:SIT family siderophore-iron:H+ symporter-like MFS transporter